MEKTVPVSQRERSIAAILGAAVADAAAQPLHWVYNSQTMDEAIAGCQSTPEFLSPAANPFYTINLGETSCYGDQMFIVLESLRETKGVFSREHFKNKAFEYFAGSESRYKNFVPNSKEIQNGPYLQTCLKNFIANSKEGKEYPECGDPVAKDLDGPCKLPSIVAVYAGKSEMLDRAEEAVRVIQNNDHAIAFSLAYARILESIILTGCSPAEAVDQCIATLADKNRTHPNTLDDLVVEKIKQAIDLKVTAHRSVAEQLGKSCPIPHNFQNAIHAMISNDDYAAAVRTTMVAGGCNASRAGIVGACLAAYGGPEVIPPEWIKKTTRAAVVKEIAEELLHQQQVHT